MDWKLFFSIAVPFFVTFSGLVFGLIKFIVTREMSKKDTQEEKLELMIEKLDQKLDTNFAEFQQGRGELALQLERLRGEFVSKEECRGCRDRCRTHRTQQEERLYNAMADLSKLVHEGFQRFEDKIDRIVSRAGGV